MGFDPSNILTPFDVRVENFYNTVDTHEEQRKKILLVISLLKLAGAGDVFMYLKKSNGGMELFPLTSVRARITELRQEEKIIFIKKDKSQLYNSTESKYKIREFTGGLF